MFDLIIQHARICDGTGNPSFLGTLGVTDRRITYLGRETGLAAARLGDLLARAIPQVTPRPIFMQGDLRNPSMYSTYRAWQPAFQRTVAEQIALYQHPAFRAAFVEDIALRKRDHLWEQTRVLEVMHPALASYEGKTMHEIAALQGRG